MLLLQRYLLTLFIFLAIDMIWLLGLARGFYSQHIGHLMADDADLVAAVAFYLLNTAGILTFVLTPAIRKKSIASAAIHGACYGLFTYATYDLTNRATLKDWPWIVVWVDLVWGIFVTGAASSASYWIGTKLKLKGF